MRKSLDGKCTENEIKAAKQQITNITKETGERKRCPFAGLKPCAKAKCRMWNDDMKFCCLDAEGFPYILYDVMIGLMYDELPYIRNMMGRNDNNER